MNYLVGDIGNTLIKISVLNHKFKIKKSYNLDTQKIYKKKFLDILFKNLKNKKFNSKILISSVVPSAYKVISSYLAKKKYKVFEIKNLKIKRLIKFDIKNIKQLGSDRIANSICLDKKINHLIIDFGTATTFDIIKKNKYLGGVIAPGINLSIKNLNKFTALLPLIDLKDKQNSYGKNTKDAMNAGFLWGYEGLVNNIINKIIKKTKTRYKIILTGGHAYLFRKFIKHKTRIDQNITIKGVAEIYKKLLV